MKNGPTSVRKSCPFPELKKKKRERGGAPFMAEIGTRKSTTVQGCSEKQAKKKSRGRGRDTYHHRQCWEGSSSNIPASHEKNLSGCLQRRGVLGLEVWTKKGLTEIQKRILDGPGPTGHKEQPIFLELNHIPPNMKRKDKLGTSRL